MLGDKIIVKPYHTRAAVGVYEKIRDKVIDSSGSCISISVAGESGSGKSEIASEIARLLFEKDNITGIILHQDDYFKLPPKSNDEVRRKNISNVGINEVEMDLLNIHMGVAKSREAELKKPLIDYDNNIILEETVIVNGVRAVLAEGTYTTLLDNANIKIFIDRTYLDTLQHRKERARDKLDEYTEKILKIEHDIISAHKEMADIIINKDYSVDK